jgi:hypothetical protein
MESYLIKPQLSQLTTFMIKSERYNLTHQRKLLPSPPEPVLASCLKIKKIALAIIHCKIGLPFGVK